LTVPVIIRPAAETDLQDSWEWSESLEPGLGTRLLVNVGRIVETLENHPFAFPVFYREARRAVVPHSPYLLFHVSSESRVVVVACFSVHRDPRWVRRALRRRQVS
jgi:plasmid stabilization system protein ParE